MYVCMYLCMYVCMYVRMYVCMGLDTIEWDRKDTVDIDVHNRCVYIYIYTILQRSYIKLPS